MKLSKRWEEMNLKEQLQEFLQAVIQDKTIPHNKEMILIQKLCEIYNYLAATTGLISAILEDIDSSKGKSDE